MITLYILIFSDHIFRSTFMRGDDDEVHRAQHACGRNFNKHHGLHHEYEAAVQCMWETCNHEREIQQTSCAVTWTQSMQETIYWQEGDSTNMMCCSVNWKLQ